MLKLSCGSFTNNTAIPLKNSYENENMSPPLHWSNFLPATQSFALVMDAPDTASVICKTFDHWLLCNIPRTALEMPEDLHNSLLPNISTQGATTRGEVGYMDPCPPKRHRRPQIHLPPLCTVQSIQAQGIINQGRAIYYHQGTHYFINDNIRHLF